MNQKNVASLTGHLADEIPPNLGIGKKVKLQANSL